MKKIIFLLCAVLFCTLSYAQLPVPLPRPAIKVTINCDSTLTLNQLPYGAVPNPFGYYVEFDGLNAPSDLLVAADPSTGVMVYQTTTSIQPSMSQYSVGDIPVDASGMDYGVYAQNYTTLMDDYLNIGGQPARIGYTYQYGQYPIQTLVCPTQSATTFAAGTNHGKKWLKGKGPRKGRK